MTSTKLDDLLPTWFRRERHQIQVSAPREAVMRAAEELTWGDVPVFRTMMVSVSLGTKPFPANGRVLDMFLSNGFEVLHQSAQELVVGGVERISRKQAVVRLSDPVDTNFRDFNKPGHIKLGFNFLFIDGVLTTETRVQPTDSTAKRFFGVYWFIIRGGSGLIRHIWLRGIRNRANK